MPEAGDTDYDRLLSEAWQQLDDLSAGKGGAAPEGLGTAADGRIQVTAVRGRVEALELDPRLMRLAPAELGEQVVAAVNAALADLHGRASAAAEPAIDLGALSERLHELQGEALRTADMITQGLGDAIAKVHDRTGMTGDPGPQGLAALLERLQDTLDAVRTPAGEVAGAHGEGTAADGSVRAIAVPGGRLSSLELDPRALRLASADLAAEIRLAVNSALDQLVARVREGLPLARIDPERLRAIQRASVEQMAAYTRSLTDLMASIQEP